MKDRISLKGLRAKGFHGVFVEERTDGQEFVVDAELELDLSGAAASDQLHETVDYGALAMRLHAIVTGESVQLIETLAGRLVYASLEDPRVLAATVTVHKPEAPIPLGFEDVTVTIRRERKAVVLSLGSNLGDRMEHLEGGLAVLRSRLPVTAVSPVYETAPVGGPQQGPYLNVVVLAAAPDGAAALSAAHAAESARKRKRTVRDGPRTLDVDVITVEGERNAHADLTLPHPRAHERAFVLAPWFDVDPGAVLAGHGRVGALLEQRLAAGDEVTRRRDLMLR